MDGLVGLFGPPTMPRDLRERIAVDIKTVMDADPLFNDRLIMTAQVPNPGGPAEFAKSIDEQRGSCQGSEGPWHRAEIAQRAR
jgi:tripartite-type tricarboxylate transporter receptor subunit TctC